jgi:hypothetical protein
MQFNDGVRKQSQIVSAGSFITPWHYEVLTAVVLNPGSVQISVSGGFLTAGSTIDGSGSRGITIGRQRWSYKPVTFHFTATGWFARRINIGPGRIDSQVYNRLTTYLPRTNGNWFIHIRYAQRLTSVKILNSKLHWFNTKSLCRTQTVKHFFWKQKQNSPGGRNIY